MTMKPLSTLMLAALIIFASVLGIGHVTATAQTQRKSQSKRAAAAAAARYACPMHPEVTSRRPGKCPKCGMALRLVKDKVDEPASANDTASNTANSTAGPETKDVVAASSLRIPDVTVYNQNGRRLNFYTDLVKGKTVAINFIFTTCTTICPPLTATFRRVQQQLSEQAGSDVVLISISVDPTTDTPERLHDFAEKFKAGPGWTFVTGDKAEIDSLLRALGAAVANKNDHTPMILVGNDAASYWTRTYGLSSPAILVKVITEAANHK
jgi:cytochrome oxidase Cu insertion factor (SCO1/SenC/PrrC family)